MRKPDTARKLPRLYRKGNSAGQSNCSGERRPSVQDDDHARAYGDGTSITPDSAGHAHNREARTTLFGIRPAAPREQDMTTPSMHTLVLGAALAASMGIGYALGAQPHMYQSIGLLQSARGELVASTPNKGGHRERAIGLIDQAIDEVRAGIAFAGG
jgi:hypothetical protein